MSVLVLPFLIQCMNKYKRLENSTGIRHYIFKKKVDSDRSVSYRQQTAHGILNVCSFLWCVQM